MSETGNIEKAEDNGTVVSGWLFKLGVKSSTVIWTKEMKELITSKLNEIPDIDSFILVETSPTEILNLLGAKSQEASI